MRVQVLGPLRVEVPGQESVTPRGDRPREVLAVLLSRRGRPVPAEVILDLVWPEDAHRLTTSTVHTVVARLRRQLGSSLVHTGDLGYFVPGEVSIDADRFSELASAAHESGLAERAAEREQLCREALGLWRGPTPYDGIRSELVLAERVRLDELHRRVRFDLASGLLDLHEEGAAGEALELARGLLGANPLDEGAAALAMRAAYQLHRQAEAIEVYEALRRTLRDELGVDPGPAARELHALVLAQDESLTARRRSESVMTRRALPSLASPSIGREAEAAAVVSALAEGRRLVTVTGPGGVGKSRLLADAGALLVGKGEVAYVSLAGQDAITSTDQLAAEITACAGLALPHGDDLESLVEGLRTAELTIVIDEAEWLLEPTAQVVSAVLAGCPGVRLLVSSRVPLQVVGERVLPLEPLPTADPDAEPDDIRASPAVRLLAERLADRGSHVAPLESWSTEELRQLARVARTLDGLPLALEIAAGAASARSLAELLELVRRPLDLETDEAGRDSRQHSLRRTISWSLGRLDPQARTVLRRVAIFSGPFTAPAARAVTGLEPTELDRGLRALTRDNLLSLDRGSTRPAFRMLRTVRDLAREELSESGEEPGTRARHRRWFSARWRDAPLSDELIEEVSLTYDDHLDALRNALEVGNEAAAADIATALNRWWMFLETPSPGIRWTERLLATEGITRRQRARLEIARAIFGSPYRWSEDDLERLTLDLDGDADWGFLLFLTAGIGDYTRGDPGAGQRYVDRAIELAASKAAHHLPEGVATRAALAAAAGEPERAVALAHEAMARIGPTGSAVHLVVAVPKIALALVDAGRPQEALAMLTRAAADATDRFGIRPTSATSLNAGWAALCSGEPATARSWFTRVVTGPQAASAAGMVGQAAVGIGAALAARGETGAAELIGVGQWLLAHEGQELPPTLSGFVREATVALSPVVPPADWTVDLALAHVGQLVHASTMAFEQR